MEYKELLTIVVGFFITVITLYYQNKKNWKTLKDSQQDKKIDVIYGYVESVLIIKRLKNKIRKEVSKIVRTHHLDNSELSVLLNNSQDKFIDLVETISETDVADLSLQDLTTCMKTMAKNVQGATKWDKIDTPFPKDEQGAVIENKTYKYRLKNEVVIPNMTIYIQRLREEVIEDGKKFNGTFSKISLGVILTIIDESIRIYRECKK